MTTYLLWDAATKSPEMRHEIAEPIMDPLTFIEHDGQRILVGSRLEQQMYVDRPEIVDDFWLMEDLGLYDLLKDPSVPDFKVDLELALRALEKLGAKSVVVPPSFPTLMADFLRDRGLEVAVDVEAWALRRRKKTPGELEGIERAQRATQTALLTAARMLRESEPTDEDLLRFEGEILTAELVREAMKAELLSQETECEEILVHSGDACLAGHDLGHGPIMADQSCIIDCFPRDQRSGVHSDMTRTFVPGTPSKELRELHAHCRTALDIALGALRPGRDDAHALVSEYFESHGFPTIRSHQGSEPLRAGFNHSLGHGIGLEVHEKPWVGHKPDKLRAGDVVAIEPGLYFAGVGGVRLEDTVLITEDGVEPITEPFPYDLEP